MTTSRTAVIVGQHNLPEDLTSLIGREHDVFQVGRLLAVHRIVSLVSVGGAGKTRLALTVARGVVRDFPDGVWLVELGPVADGGLVTAGEVAWQVAPLGTPAHSDLSVEQLLEVDAIRLFVERAQAALPGFELSGTNAAAVAQLCRRLDGLPLALELAAATLKVLSPQQLAARLDERFKLLVRGSRTAPLRHQTLESAVRWSYDLLDSDDRHLFEQLSVFAGTCSLDAAEEVCGLESVFDSLARLVDQSLVLATSDDDAGDRRYRLLETLRAYGLDRLKERGEMALMRKRLTAWVLTQAEEAAASLRGPNQAECLRWAEREHDNIRSALDWSVSTGDAETALRIAGALW